MEGKYEQKLKEEYDRKEYKNHLNEKKGQPIDLETVTAGTAELEQGEREGYPADNDESDRAKLIASYPQGRLSESEDDYTEEEKKAARLTDDEIDGFARKIQYRKLHPETILTKEQLQDAISELTGAKNLIAVFAADERLSEGATRDKMLVEIVKITDKYNIRANLSEFPEKIDELIEKYTEDLKHLQGK